MIARHETQPELHDAWAKLAAPLPAGVISWRQDGRPIARDGRYIARFVAYIEAHTVRERLDSVVPGEWSLTLELLPIAEAREETFEAQPYAFKARLQILGVVREDVGTGKDYKQASTDALKRVAVRFGIGAELYTLGQNWVQMDGDGKHAKAVEDPQAAYDRRSSRGAPSTRLTDRPIGDRHADDETGVTAIGRSIAASDVPPCPKCGGRMWDNRIGKRNPKAPDFKCRTRSCDGVVWPAKATATQSDAQVTTDVAGGPADAKTTSADELPF